MTEKEKIKHFEKITGNKYNPNVETLDNSGCTGLKELPALPNVETLDNSGCTGLKELPALPNVKYLYNSGCTGLKELPALPNVKYLYNRGCTGLKELPALPNVKYLYNSGCTGLKELPEKLYLSKSIGSRYDITEYWIKSDEIKCGCFSGNLKDFKKRVLEVYPDKKNIHRINYIIFIEECENFKK